MKFALICFLALATARAEETGFTPLFNGKDLTGWAGDIKGYVAEDDVIVCRTGGNLFTEKTYSDFILRFEFKLTPGANNGIGIRWPGKGDAAYAGMEIQVLDDTAEKYKTLQPYQYHGSICGIVPAKRGHQKPVGEWNVEEISAIGPHIKVTLNGVVIVDANLDDIKQIKEMHDLAKHPGLHNKAGRIGFLGHGSVVEFRNIRLKEVVAVAAGSDDFMPLFNGKDLTGWVPCNIAPETFAVRDGLLVTTGTPIGTLRTARMYENFIAEFEWQHLKPGGNSGFFIWGDGLPATGSSFPRGIEIQILDPGYNVKGKNEWYTTHGDIFAVNGASLTVAGRISPDGKRSFPSEERTKPAPEWNHYRVVANNGDISLSVNGKEVTVAKAASPRKGYLMLESEGSEAHFRNLRIKELPSTNPQPNEIAREAKGYTALFNGKDLTGWKGLVGTPLTRAKMTPEQLAVAQAKADEIMRASWKAEKGVLVFDGNGQSLCTAKDYKDFEMLVDWKILPKGDSGIYLRGSPQVQIWDYTKNPVGSGGLYNNQKNPSKPIICADKPIGEWNTFRIKMVGEKVTVHLNDKLVTDNVTMENYWDRKQPIFPTGQIELQNHGSKLQFRNIFIREIE